MIMILSSVKAEDGVTGRIIAAAIFKDKKTCEINDMVMGSLFAKAYICHDDK
jgi:hypothetical protein